MIRFSDTRPKSDNIAKEKKIQLMHIVQIRRT